MFWLEVFPSKCLLDWNCLCEESLLSRPKLFYTKPTIESTVWTRVDSFHKNVWCVAPLMKEKDCRSMLSSNIWHTSKLALVLLSEQLQLTRPTLYQTDSLSSCFVHLTYVEVCRWACHRSVYGPVSLPLAMKLCSSCTPLNKMLSSVFASLLFRWKQVTTLLVMLGTNRQFLQYWKKYYLSLVRVCW